MKKFIIYMSGILGLSMLFLITGCSGQISDGKLVSIIEEKTEFNEVEMDSVEVLSDTFFDGDREKENELVLFKSNVGYEIIGLKNKSDVFMMPESKYDPFNYIYEYIMDEKNEAANIKNFEIISKYVENDSIECFNNVEKAKEYVREVTKSGGIIETEEAKNVISRNISSDYDYSAAKEFEILYEEGTANPLCYAGSVAEQVYQWSSFLPESHYNWLDDENKEDISFIYGPPYKLRTRWSVIDPETYEIVGECLSFDDVEKTYQKKKGSKT